VLLSTKFLSVLRLNFSDITEDIPHPTHRRFASHDAKQIIEFISRWRDVDQIVVHCRAGLSRSPGVAMGICDLHGISVEPLEREKPLFNAWVRAVLARVGNELPWPIERWRQHAEDPSNVLRNPSRLWARCEVLQRASPVPASSGLHAWFFRDVPPGVAVGHAIVQHGFTLLSVGIAPSRNGTSTTLRSRIRRHYAGNAAGSWLRRTLGRLLAKELGIELTRSGSSRRLTFGTGEERLSEWMAANAFVCWVEHPRPWEINDDVIGSLRPPLNAEPNGAHRFYGERQPDFVGPP
jgi:hypothetical protein